LKNFHIQRARSHSFGPEAMAEGPPDMKFYMKNFFSKDFFFFFFFVFYLKFVLSQRAHSHTFGAKAMAAGPPN
jgi:hypothetical protein